MLVDNFVTYSSAMLGRSNRTCSEYAKEVRFFARWLSTDVELTEDEALLVAARSDVQAYIEHCNTAGNAGSTRARKVSSLRSFYNYCLEYGHVPINPLAGMPRPKFQRPLPVFLSLHDAKLLIHTSRKRNDIFYRHRNTAIVQLFVQCGLRLSELANIRSSDCYDDAILILGKGKKERYVVLNVAAQKALKRWIARRGISPGSPWVSKQLNQISCNAVYSNTTLPIWTGRYSITTADSWACQYYNHGDLHACSG